VLKILRKNLYVKLRDSFWKFSIFLIVRPLALARSQTISPGTFA
jgi:hypothetical protein